MIQSGTYRLGELTNVELKTGSSAVVKITIAGSVVLDETLYSDADGIVRIARLNELLEPYCNVGGSTTVTVKVGSTTYTLTVTYHLLTDGNNTTSQDTINDGPTSREGIAPVRTFTFVNADGESETLDVWGVETEHPEVTTTFVNIDAVTEVVESRYEVKHTIETSRISGSEVKAFTRMIASKQVYIGLKEVIIDADAELMRTLNDPLADRMAKLSWRYASVNEMRTEYRAVPATLTQSSDLEGQEPLRTFVYLAQDGRTYQLKLWGMEEQRREWQQVLTMVEGKQVSVDKAYLVWHNLQTARMSRAELRALVVMLASSSVTLNGRSVIFADASVEISSDTQSDRTASLAWRWADAKVRTTQEE